jgi:hypothetical protein
MPAPAGASDQEKLAMRRSGLSVAMFVGALALAPAALADPQPAALPPLPAPPSSAPAAPPSAATGSPAMAPPAAAVANGIAVVATAGATDATWPLAQAVYATATLRPGAVDEAHARVLCGEPAPPASPGDLRDLADTVAAVRGEDAASRAILTDIARKLNVRALVVVHVDAGKPVARVFVAETQAFDAASYAPDVAAGPTTTWAATTASLTRSFGGTTVAPVPVPAEPPTAAPPLATHEEPAVTNTPPKPKAFYESGWFWGALGAAAFAGGAVYFATRDNGASTIHLDMQVPH